MTKEELLILEKILEKIDKADGKMQPLDYIFSVEILNEGWEFP